MEQSFGGMKKEIEKFFEDGSLGLTAKSVTKTSLWLEVHNRRREQSDCDGSSGSPEQSELSFQSTVIVRSAPIHVAPPKNNESARTESHLLSLLCGCGNNERSHFQP